MSTVQDAVMSSDWAVVGVSEAHHKFGRRIFEHLRSRGYRVRAVNPRLVPALADGTPVWASISDLDPVPAVVNVVVPPAEAAGILEMCRAIGVPIVWFQPGAEDPLAIARAEDAGMRIVHGGACALVEADGPLA
jgi:predicted CoA-binding protein